MEQSLDSKMFKDTETYKKKEMLGLLSCSMGAHIANVVAVLWDFQRRDDIFSICMEYWNIHSDTLIKHQQNKVRNAVTD